MSVRLPCCHPSRRLGRVIFRDGSVHIEERCSDCGENVRGGGIRVPHDEVQGDVNALPLFRDYRDARPERQPQPSLFDGLL